MTFFVYDNLTIAADDKPHASAPTILPKLRPTATENTRNSILPPRARFMSLKTNFAANAMVLSGVDPLGLLMNQRMSPTMRMFRHPSPPLSEFLALLNQDA